MFDVGQIFPVVRVFSRFWQQVDSRVVRWGLASEVAVGTLLARQALSTASPAGACYSMLVRSCKANAENSQTYPGEQRQCQQLDNSRII